MNNPQHLRLHRVARSFISVLPSFSHIDLLATYVYVVLVNNTSLYWNTFKRSEGMTVKDLKCIQSGLITQSNHAYICRRIFEKPSVNYQSFNALMYRISIYEYELVRSIRKAKKAEEELRKSSTTLRIRRDNLSISHFISSAIQKDFPPLN